MEKESKHTPEEMAKIQKERTSQDAEFIKGGAENRSDEKGKLGLEPTYEQKETIRLEKELGKEGSIYDDLATYIRLNKRVVCPKEELGDDKVKEEILKNKGVVWWESGSGYSFIDEDGNIVGFWSPQPGEIKSLEGAFSKDHSYYSIDKMSEMIKQELEKNGFNTLPLERITEEHLKSLIGRIKTVVFNHWRKSKAEQEEKKNKEFDF